MSNIFFADSRHLFITADPTMDAVVEYCNKPSSWSNVLGVVLLVFLLLIASDLAGSQYKSLSISDQKPAAQEYVKGPTVREVREKELAVLEAHKKKQSLLLTYLSNTYKGVSENALQKIIQWSYEASIEYAVDQTLILSVMAKESGFNPYVKSKSHAEGLMQIITYWHMEKMGSIGGAHNIVEPRDNIFKGAEILREYLDLHGQDTVKALQQYNGSLEDETQSYSSSVLSHRRQMDQYLKRNNTGAT